MTRANTVARGRKYEAESSVSHVRTRLLNRLKEHPNQHHKVQDADTLGGTPEERMGLDKESVGHVDRAGEREDMSNDTISHGKPENGDAMTKFRAASQR